MSFKKTFFKNVLVTGGYNYVSQAITFLSSFITARLLLPENYGLVGLITVFTNFISVFADSGISLAIVKSDYKSSYHKAMDSMSLIIGLVLFFLTSCLAWPIAAFYNNHNLILPTIVLAATFVTRSLSIVRGALLSKNLQFNEIGKLTLINTIVTVTMTIILALLHAEHWSIIIPQFVTSLISVLYYERRIKLGYRFYPFRYVRVAFRQTRRTIGSLLGFNFVNYWSRNADNLLVGKFYGTNDLGIYNRAYSLLTLPLSLVTGLMGTVLYPSLSKLKSEGGDINTEYSFVLRVISVIVYPIAFVLILFPTQLVSLFWGENWIKVSVLLPYFGILIFGQSLLSTSGNILVLQGKEKQLMISGWVGSFFTIAGIAAGAFLSLEGIAQFYSLSFILIVLPFNTVYIFLRTLHFRSRDLLRSWLPIIVFSVVLWVSCYTNAFWFKFIFLICMLITIALNSFKEIKTATLSMKKQIEGYSVKKSNRNTVNHE